MTATQSEKILDIKYEECSACAEWLNNSVDYEAGILLLEAYCTDRDSINSLISIKNKHRLVAKIRQLFDSAKDFIENFDSNKVAEKPKSIPSQEINTKLDLTTEAINKLNSLYSDTKAQLNKRSALREQMKSIIPNSETNKKKRFQLAKQILEKQKIIDNIYDIIYEIESTGIIPEDKPKLTVIAKDENELRALFNIRTNISKVKKKIDIANEELLIESDSKKKKKIISNLDKWQINLTELETKKKEYEQ
jgi:hypothetical protein